MPPVHDPRFSELHRQSLIEGARQDAAVADRWLYYTPLIMLGCGLLAMALITMSQSEGGLIAGVIAIPVYMIVIAVLSIVGLAAMFVVCALFKSDAGPLWLAMLRLAGVYAVILPIATLLAPTACVGAVISGLILAGIIAMIFDMEMVEGVVFAVLSWFLVLGIQIALAAILA